MQLGKFQLRVFGREDFGDDSIGEVFAAEHALARTRSNFQRPFKDFHHGDVEGTAAQVDHDDVLFVVASVETVDQCRGRWQRGCNGAAGAIATT